MSGAGRHQGAQLTDIGSESQRKRTSENGAELLPAGDAALRGELTQGDLQEEDRQASAKQEDEVGDEKCACVDEETAVKNEQTHTHTKER